MSISWGQAPRQAACSMGRHAAVAHRSTANIQRCVRAGPDGLYTGLLASGVVASLVCARGQGREDHQPASVCRGARAAVGAGCCIAFTSALHACMHAAAACHSTFQAAVLRSEAGRRRQQLARRGHQLCRWRRRRALQLCRARHWRRRRLERGNNHSRMRLLPEKHTAPWPWTRVSSRRSGRCHSRAARAPAAPRAMDRVSGRAMPPQAGTRQARRPPGGKRRRRCSGSRLPTSPAVPIGQACMGLQADGALRNQPGCRTASQRLRRQARRWRSACTAAQQLTAAARRTWQPRRHPPPFAA